MRMILLKLTLLFAMPVMADDAARDFEAARNKEVVQGDLPGAIAMYKRILSRHKSNREISARALFQLGDCQEKLGQAEARQSYQRVVKEFADQRSVVGQAQDRLAALGGAAARAGAVQLRRVLDSAHDCGYPSLDGASVLCAKGDLVLRHLSSGKETLIERGKRVAWRVLSSDGKWLAYTSHDSYPGKLWLASAAGTVKRELRIPPETGGARALAFSPDASWLLAAVVYERRTAELWLYSVPEGQGHRIDAANGIADVTEAYFTPDGKYIAANCAQKGNYLIPAQGGEARRIPIADNEYPKGFSKEGSLVYFSPSRGGTASLWTMKIGDGRAVGEPVVLTRGLPAHQSGRYYPTGKYYHYLDANRFELRKADLSTGASQPATEFDQGQGVGPDYSFDGTRLAFVNRDQTKGEIIVRDLQTGSETTHRSPLAWTQQVRWFPDGKHLLVFGTATLKSQDNQLVRLNLTDGEVTLLSADIGRTDASTNPIPGADGRYIYYKRFVDFDKLRWEGMRVYRFDMQSRDHEEVYRAPSGSMVRLFAVSRDGTKLAVGERDSEGKDWLSLHNIGGSQIARLPWPGGRQRSYNGLVFTADAKSVILHGHATPDSGDDVWLHPLNGAPARKLLHAGIVWNMATHPNGRDVLLESREYRHELWVMDGLN